jgi:hypothetical protein
MTVEVAPATAPATTAPAPATPAQPAAAAPAAAPAPAAPAPPLPRPQKPSEADVLRAFDNDFESIVAKTKAEMANKGDAEPKPEPTEPEKKAEPAKEPEKKAEAAPEKKEGEETTEEEPAADAEWEEGVVPPTPEKALPSREREALKAIKDPEIRRAFARAHYLVKGYERAGMRLSDIPKYIAVAPTPEVLEERVTRAGQLDAFVEEFSSGQPDAIFRVAEVLHQTSPDGWTNLVDAIIDNIHTVRPNKMKPLGDRFMRAVVGNMREKAEKDSDLTIADHADFLEEWLGLKSAAKGRAGRDETRLDPDIQRRLAEADEISRREKQREAEAFQRGYAEFNNRVVSTATNEGVNYVRDWIEENCAAYSDEVKAELFDRMATQTLSAVRGNAQVEKTLRRLMDDGPGDEAHLKRCADYLVRTSRSAFVTIAPGVLTKFQKVFRQVTAKQAEKTARAKSSRDIGASGAPVVTPERRLVGKGKHPDDVLKEFDALAQG